MKKLTRILLLAGTVLLLRGQMPVDPLTCCMDTPLDYDNPTYPCGDAAHQCCTGRYTAFYAVADCTTGNGPNALYQEPYPNSENTDCGNLDTLACSPDSTCPALPNDNQPYWQMDDNCLQAPPGGNCGNSGNGCTYNSDCCSGLYCISGICGPCSPDKGQSCTAPGVVCGQIQCDGACGESGLCCTTAGDPCYGEQGSCCGPNSCDECACNEYYPCGTCGEFECDGTTCDDPCSGGGGGDRGDPCEYADCEFGCTEVGGVAECDYEDDPVILSLDGSTFALTSAANGVRFDFYGNHQTEQISWTAAGANIGWLALDINRNGRIDSGQELFSNVMPQPGRAGTHLGFRALAVSDQPAFKGNGDGWIDAKDAVFSRLRVWVDSNHNGISEPSELLTMQEAGIQAISVHYLPDNWTDQYGNRFRNRAEIVWTNPNRGTGQGRDRWAYDVVLMETGGK
jgi:hypothetical protein